MADAGGQGVFVGDPIINQRDAFIRGDRFAFFVQQFWRDISFYIKITFGIVAVDLAKRAHGFAGYEIGQRDQAVAGAEAQCIDGGQKAVFFWQAHADVDFLV